MLCPDQEVSHVDQPAGAVLLPCPRLLRRRGSVVRPEPPLQVCRPRQPARPRPRLLGVRAVHERPPEDHLTGRRAWAARTLAQARSVVTRWSTRRRSTIRAALASRSVARRSAELGVGSPDGWLWTSAKALPSLRSTALSTSRTGSRHWSALPSLTGTTRRTRWPGSRTTTSTRSRRSPPSCCRASRA